MIGDPSETPKLGFFPKDIENLKIIGQYLLLGPKYMAMDLRL